MHLLLEGRPKAPLVLLLAGIVGAFLLGACNDESNDDPGGLAGTSWELTMLDGQDALPDVSAWLQFDEGSLLQGSTGCNSLSGSWESSGSNLLFHDIATTLIGCPGPVGEQEAAFTAALRETASYTSEGETLTLEDGKGDERMKFAPKTDLAPTP